MEFPCTDFTKGKKKNFVTLPWWSNFIICYNFWSLELFFFKVLSWSAIRTINRAILPIVFPVFFPTSHCHHKIERITLSTHHTKCCLWQEIWCSVEWKWGNSVAGVCCCIKEGRPSKSLIWSSGIWTGWWAEGERSHRPSRGNNLALSSVCAERIMWLKTGNRLCKEWTLWVSTSSTSGGDQALLIL